MKVFRITEVGAPGPNDLTAEDVERLTEGWYQLLYCEAQDDEDDDKILAKLKKLDIAPQI